MTVRTCPSCRRENAESARFCVACGTALVSACAECGAEIPPDADFCPACGTPVAGHAAPAGEERKVVTVLFVDLVDSTSHGERLDPEDLRGLLSQYFARVRAETRLRARTECFASPRLLCSFAGTHRSPRGRPFGF